MVRRIATLFLLLAPVLVLGQCKQIPTSILLHIEAGEGLVAPEALELSVFAEAGVAVAGQRLPACKADPSPCSGKVRLPDDAVLYPEEEQGVVRVLVRALSVSGTVTGEGTNSVVLRTDEQVEVTVVINIGRRPDSDGDGVPDAIDNCPHVSNPSQGPCSATDAGIDAASDGPLPDGQTPDGPLPDGPLPDGQTPDGPLPDGPLPDGQTPDGPLPDGPLPDGQTPDQLLTMDGALCPVACTLGCQPDTATCRSPVPSGGFSVQSYATVPEVDSDRSIDTTTCQLTASGWGVLVSGTVQTGTGGVQACVVGLESLVVQTAATVTVTGDYPLVLLVKQDVSISGVVDVGAHGAVPGPGGALGGAAPSAGGPSNAGDGTGGGQTGSCSGSGDDCGGGGGGYGSPGAPGGEEKAGCGTLPLGGIVYGDVSLVPLLAGSGGASGGQNTCCTAGVGGAGGGALQISCGGVMSIDGAISAGGGGGLAGSGTEEMAGGGGGSGGGILLEAVAFTGSGLVAANGGGGAGAYDVACSAAATDGEDGGPWVKAALGGTAGTSCGAGGDGGYGVVLPTAGATASGGGGGGGGGVGRIRLNWYNHSAPAPVIVSGLSSLGELIVQ
jgi:hypothetical protein